MFQNNLNLNIILPTFNEEKNIEFLIPAIINSFNDQNYINYEITVVDDNSTDRTAEIVYNLSVNYNNVKFIQRQDYPSLPLSINEGIHTKRICYVARCRWIDGY